MTDLAGHTIREPQRLAWVKWLTDLGVDPCDVAVPGVITRDLPNRRVCWLAVTLATGVAGLVGIPFVAWLQRGV